MEEVDLAKSWVDEDALCSVLFAANGMKWIPEWMGLERLNIEYEMAAASSVTLVSQEFADVGIREPIAHPIFS